MLFGAGALASGVNAVAGGGSLLSFPALTLGFGLSTSVGNATNSVALWPGSLGGVLGFWARLRDRRDALIAMAVPTLAGSGCGAWLFVSTPVGIFDLVVPWLILLAAGLLAFQPQIRTWATGGQHRLPFAVGVALQFFVALYGGYFGAGMGILMLAVFGLVVEGTLHDLNALKNGLGVIINVMASAIFLSRGLVASEPAIVLAAGALLGGFAGAKLSQRADPERLRKAVVVFGVALAVVYLWRHLAAD